MFGWLIVPLLFDGVDRTLDPLKLARFPLRTGTLMAAMFLVGITWVPGIATILVSVGTAIAWRTHPLSAVAAVVGGLVGAATCIAGSRLTTSIAGRPCCAAAARREPRSRRSGLWCSRSRSRSRRWTASAEARVALEFRARCRGARLVAARRCVVGPRPPRAG